MNPFATGVASDAAPTSAISMGGLVLSRVGYDRWLRFVFPYCGIVLVICIAFMVVGAAIG